MAYPSVTATQEETRHTHTHTHGSATTKPPQSNLSTTPDRLSFLARRSQVPVFTAGLVEGIRL